MNGLVGIIDGTHIPIVNYAINEQKIDFTNRKSFYSINLTLVVDFKERIIAASYEQPGREGDSTIYRQMNIYKNYSLFFNEGEYLFGDKAYPLSKNLLTPFKGISRDGISGKSFYNFRHASVRSVVERAIGRLKARWAVLDMVYVRSQEKANMILKVATILHNVCLQNNDNFEFNPVAENETATYPDRQAEPSQLTGKIMREHLMATLLRRYQ